jgi:hypothetical protein
MGANEVKIFKILTFEWIWNYTSFENLMKADSLFYTQDVISYVRDTEASSAYIFQSACVHMQRSVNSNNLEIIQRILCPIIYEITFLLLKTLKIPWD